MNPAQGRAIERARDQQHLDLPDASSHWVTIHGHHVLIREPQTGPAQQKPRRRMSLSSNGLDFIKRHEDYSGRLYPDSAGNLTIGYGHLIKRGENFTAGITEKEAAALLAQDVQAAVNALNEKLRSQLTQSEFDALVDFTYNLGAGNLVKSTLLANINSGKDVTEANFTNWDRAGGQVVRGLTVRRTNEYHLFSDGDYGDR